MCKKQHVSLNLLFLVLSSKCFREFVFGWKFLNGGGDKVRYGVFINATNPIKERFKKARSVHGAFPSRIYIVLQIGCKHPEF